MLNKFMLRAAATAVALTCAAGPASAENYEVLMMDYAFFPEISYVVAGDTITFTNMSGITRVIQSRNGSWATPEIPDGGQATLFVAQGMQNTYLTRVDGVGSNGINTSGGGGGGSEFGADFTTGEDLSGASGEEGTIIGKLNFSGAPVIAEN